MSDDAITPRDLASADDGMRAVVAGKTLEQWPADLYIPPEALEVVLESFEGPLDLLLYLIRKQNIDCLLYTSPSPRDATLSRMPSSA